MTQEKIIYNTKSAQQLIEDVRAMEEPSIKTYQADYVERRRALVKEKYSDAEIDNELYLSRMEDLTALMKRMDFFKKLSSIQNLAPYRTVPHLTHFLAYLDVLSAEINRWYRVINDGVDYLKERGQANDFTTDIIRAEVAIFYLGRYIDYGEDCYHEMCKTPQ